MGGRRTHRGSKVQWMLGTFPLPLRSVLWRRVRLKRRTLRKVRVEEPFEDKSQSWTPFKIQRRMVKEVRNSPILLRPRSNSWNWLCTPDLHLENHISSFQFRDSEDLRVTGFPWSSPIGTLTNRVFLLLCLRIRFTETFNLSSVYKSIEYRGVRKKRAYPRPKNDPQTL